SMIVLAALIFLPTWVVTLLGITLIAGHNYFDGPPPKFLEDWPGLWTFLDGGNPLEPWPGVQLYVAYPLLPWLGVMAAGYGFGSLWLLDRERRRRWLVGLGLTLIVLFGALRYINRYGDPFPWTEQATGLFTVLSFINCWKYPPSLLF